MEADKARSVLEEDVHTGGWPQCQGLARVSLGKYVSCGQNGQETPEKCMSHNQQRTQP